MSEEKNVTSDVTASDIEKKAMRNIAKAETRPLQVDKSIPSYDMAVMTIIAVIAIICIAFSVVTTFTNPPSRQASSSSTAIQNQDLATYKITKYSELPEGVAAVVNGVEIPESRITDYVESYRKSMDLEDEQAWTEFVFESYKTTDNLRNFMLEMMINQEIVTQAAATIGFEVTDEEIEELIEDDMEQKGIESKEKYWEIVIASGYNEDTFISQNRNNILQNDIVYYVNPEESYADTFDDQVLAYIKQSYPAYKDIESLDEVSENLQASAREYLKWILNVRAYNEFMDVFIEDSDIEVAAPPADLPYAADTGKLQFEDFIDSFKRKIEVQSNLGGESMDDLNLNNESALDSPAEPADDDAQADEVSDEDASAEGDSASGAAASSASAQGSSSN